MAEPLHKSEAYYANLAAIKEAFPQKRVLTIADVSRYLGINTRTAAKYYKIKAGTGITIERLAVMLS